MSFEEKILPFEELASVVDALKNEGKTVVHCHGVFDLVHPGHIRHFQSARKEGDVLIVTLTPDEFVNKGPGRPVFTDSLRAEQLASLDMVDYVAVNRWPTAVETITLLKPSVYAKGPDYKDQSDDVTGKISEEQSAVEAVGGRLHVTEDITFSSSKLLNDHSGILSNDAKSFLSLYKEGHSVKDVIDLLDSFADKNVLVVGDAIIDEYHYCHALGLASKSATINARFLEAEEYAGGALAVANHIAGFCKNVDLVTVLGSKDSKKDFIESHLKENVSLKTFERSDGPTTVKRRFVDPFRIQKMFEVTYIADTPLPEPVEKQLNDHLHSALGSYDIILVADFGHGMLNPSTVDMLCSSSAYLALNIQTNSANFGHNPVTRYKRGNYVCIDERELRLAYHDKYGAIDPLIAGMSNDLKTDSVTVTRGASGSTTLQSGTSVDVPVFTGSVLDTVGAGDAFYSLASLTACSGADGQTIGFLGNVAGAIASNIVGNKESVDPVTLKKFVSTLLK